MTTCLPEIASSLFVNCHDWQNAPMLSYESIRKTKLWSEEYHYIQHYTNQRSCHYHKWHHGHFPKFWQRSIIEHSGWSTSSTNFSWAIQPWAPWVEYYTSFVTTILSPYREKYGYHFWASNGGWTSVWRCSRPLWQRTAHPKTTHSICVWSMPTWLANFSEESLADIFNGSFTTAAVSTNW